MEKYNLIANDVRKKILEGVYQPNERYRRLDLQTSWGRDFCYGPVS